MALKYSLSLSCYPYYFIVSPYWLKLIKQCVHSVAAYTVVVVVCKMAQAIVDIFSIVACFGVVEMDGGNWRKNSRFLRLQCVWGAGGRVVVHGFAASKTWQQVLIADCLFTFVIQHTANPFVTSNLQTNFKIEITLAKNGDCSATSGSSFLFRTTKTIENIKVVVHDRGKRPEFSLLATHKVYVRTISMCLLMPIWYSWLKNT